MKKIFLLIIMAASITAFGLPENAMSLMFELDTEFSDAQSPSGVGPWLTATFEDIDDSTVRLTLAASGLTGDEFIAGVKDGKDDGKGWYFNFNPYKDADNLTFTWVSGNAADLIATGGNIFKADGDGSYDILFGWDKSIGALTAGETAVYEITSTYGNQLEASWFNYLSQPPTGGNGPFLSAAHVQGIYDPLGSPGNTDGSGWIAPDPVPEPATMLLLGAGLAGLAGFRKARKRKM